MPRPRKTLAELQASGAVDHNPARFLERMNEPVPAGPLGPPPKDFTKEQKKVWKELEKIALPGVLGNCDRWSIETICKLKAKERADTISDTARGQLIALYSKMGMTPSDRSRVSAKPQPKKTESSTNPWDALSRLDASSDTSVKQ